MLTKLSVNINKIATLRNSRGGSRPSVLQAAIDCQAFGADGITIHPRPDERHIRYSDAREIAGIITTEFNIEGNPKEDKFVQLVLEVRPAQVTLVPDDPGQLTSNHGWDTIKERTYLRDMTEVFHKAGIRVSIFTDPVESIVAAAADTGTDRVELYTEDYARHYQQGREAAVATYVKAAQVATTHGLGINAGHDLDMDNLGYFTRTVPRVQEVSIGHALIADALYYGLENTIQLYKRAIARG
ncbi:pyridoxine 5'-phosphate synthase [Nemorincola caseinilytica]|uniref:Pyridoxine 5'-phosphate synthase n=1 Tax=Nemorincola caseinilytica TaxID=2054315 RepID=A0ABP8NBB3_9BACT